MGSFDAGDGAIHLLFAEEDDYYTDSLIRMDLQQYLDYRLRKSKYEYIYFFRETGRIKGMFGSAEGVTAECLDSKSADRYPTDIFQYMMPSRVSVQHLSRGKTCRHQFAGRREDAALRRCDRDQDALTRLISIIKIGVEVRNADIARRVEDSGRRVPGLRKFAFSDIHTYIIAKLLFYLCLIRQLTAKKTKRSCALRIKNPGNH